MIWNCLRGHFGIQHSHTPQLWWAADLGVGDPAPLPQLPQRSRHTVASSLLTGRQMIELVNSKKSMLKDAMVDDGAIATPCRTWTASPHHRPDIDTQHESQGLGTAGLCLPHRM